MQNESALLEWTHILTMSHIVPCVLTVSPHKGARVTHDYIYYKVNVAVIDESLCLKL